MVEGKAEVLERREEVLSWAEDLDALGSRPQRGSGRWAGGASVPGVRVDQGARG